jgi:hypothetical protein
VPVVVGGLDGRLHHQARRVVHPHVETSPPLERTPCELVRGRRITGIGDGELELSARLLDRGAGLVGGLERDARDPGPGARSRDRDGLPDTARDAGDDDGAAGEIEGRAGAGSNGRGQRAMACLGV